MDPNDDEVWEGLEELVTLPKLTDQDHVPVALGIHEVSEVDHQNPDRFLAIGPIDCYCFGQLQLQQDLFIHRQEERILGSVAEFANDEMDTKVSQSTSYGSSPTERKRKEQCRAEKRKQSSVASTSKSKRKKLTPEEEEEEQLANKWANTLFNDDKYGRIEVEVKLPNRRKINVMVPSELSTIAEIKREISGYFLTVNGDDVGVERMVLSMDSAHAPTQIVCQDNLTLREMNTTDVKLRLLPQ